MEFLFNYTEINPLAVKNYPYGFRLRTTIYYWIETTPKKGDRFCSQTIDPRDGRRNKPKKSTYYSLGVMTRKENGHIGWIVASIYTERAKLDQFIEAIGGVEKLNPEQRKMYNSLIGIYEVKVDEFTGKKKKDFSVKWEKETVGAGWKEGKWNPGEKGKYVEVKITFDRPEGVTLKEIYEAMKSLNQKSLNEVFEVRDYGNMGTSPGTVIICTRGGNYLGEIQEEDYRNYLASDANVLVEENNG